MTFPLYPTRRIAVAMSGGVDSSVAAYLLQQQNNPCHTLLGLFMSNWSTHDDDSHNGRHCHEVDYQDAQRTCEHLGLPPLQYASFAKEYWSLVFEPFVSAIAEEDSAIMEFALSTYDDMDSLRTILSTLRATKEITLVRQVSHNVY